ncbi:MAG: sugar ABC transporter substrate-binding protein [Solirubrobacterales bacterium]
MAVALLGVVALASGCGSGGSGSSGSSGGSGGADIAFLAGVVDHSYTPAQVKGLEAGGQGSVQTYNPEFNPTKQVEQCQDAIASQRYDAIVVTPVSNTSAIPCAKEAAAASIPLVVDQTVIGPNLNEIQPQVEGVTGSVILVPKSFAEYSWELIQEACGNTSPCQVVNELSFEGDPLFEEELNYVKEQSEGTSIEVVATYESQYEPSQTTSKLPDILLAHPDTSVVLCANDPTALAAAEVVKETGKQSQIKVIGTGGTATAKAAIESGKLFGTIATYPQTMSKIEGEIARKAADGEKTPPSTDGFTVGSVVGGVTKANVTQFEPQW